MAESNGNGVMSVILMAMTAININNILMKMAISISG
jgi:hypothetical protein